jgi:hypothetical protein
MGENEDESADLFKLRDDLGARADRLEIESVRDLSFHGSKTLESQLVLNERVTDWARRLIKERVPS